MASASVLVTESCLPFRAAPAAGNPTIVALASVARGWPQEASQGDRPTPREPIAAQRREPPASAPFQSFAKWCKRPHTMTPSEPEGPMTLLTSRLLLLRDLKPLPIRARRPLVFLITLALLVALTGGLAYFQFVIKPNLVKGFISAAFAPKPTTVTVEAARVEQWPPELTAIGTLRAIQGRRHRAAGGRRRHRDPFRIGRRRRGRRAADQYRRFGRAGGSRQRPRPAHERRGRRLTRQKTLVVKGNTPQSTRRCGARDARLGRRDASSARRAIIAQKAINAPFAGRLGLRNVDLGQYVAVGTSLVTLQQLDPIYVDFPVPEEALSTLAAGQAVSMTVDAIPGRSFHRKDRGDRRARQRGFAQRDRARRVRQSRPQAAARHVRQSDGHDRRAAPTC